MYQRTLWESHSFLENTVDFVLFRLCTFQNAFSFDISFFPHSARETGSRDVGRFVIVFPGWNINPVPFSFWLYRGTHTARLWQAEVNCRGILEHQSWKGPKRWSPHSLLFGKGRAQEVQRLVWGQQSQVLVDLEPRFPNSRFSIFRHALSLPASMPSLMHSPAFGWLLVTKYDKRNVSLESFLCLCLGLAYQN